MSNKTDADKPPVYVLLLNDVFTFYEHHSDDDFLAPHFFLLMPKTSLTVWHASIQPIEGTYIHIYVEYCLIIMR